MLQKLKKSIPWVLVIILSVILLWPKRNNKNESTIESQLRIEESLVDSFSSYREFIILERDSSLQSLDTSNVENLVNVLKENIKWYEKITSPIDLDDKSSREIRNSSK